MTLISGTYIIQTHLLGISYNPKTNSNLRVDCWNAKVDAAGFLV